MKKDWTYKKLGEIAEIVMGQSPSGESINENVGVEFHQGKVFFGEKYLEYSNSKTDSPTKIAEAHSLLLCVRAPVGIVNITERKICIGRGLCAIRGREATTDYLYHVLKSKLTYFETNSTGSTFKAISSSVVKDTTIPVPPISIQESIVRELDAIHGILEKKQEQLRELDNLAQAIFYEMFGDPITNPKQWEVKKLGEVCEELFAGGDVPKDDFSEEENEIQNIPIYSNGIKNEGLYGYTSKPRVFNPAVTISGRGTIGASFIRTTPFLPVIRLIVAVPNKMVNIIYFAESIKLLNFEGNGNSIPQLTIPKVKEYSIPLPPLSLQQSFAAKIEAIEAQKQAVQQSIREVEALLAERMDNYFS